MRVIRCPIAKFKIGQKVVVKFLKGDLPEYVKIGDILTIISMFGCSAFNANLGKYDCCCCEKCGGYKKKLITKNGKIIKQKCLGSIINGYALGTINSLKVFLENGT